MRYKTARALIEKEASRGLTIHPKFESYEEGVQVIGRELLELQLEVRLGIDQGNPEGIKEEAVHVAATAFLFLADLFD